MPSHDYSPTLLDSVQETLKDIGRNRPMDEFLQATLDQLCHFARASRGAVMKVDPASRRLKIITTCGAGWTREKRALEIPLGKQLVGRVALDGRACLNHSSSSMNEDYPLFSYVLSAMAAPLVVRGHVWGVICLDSGELNAFDDSSLAMAVTFAQLCSLIITMQEDQAEQRLLRERLAQCESLAMLGESMGGIAHEINNPLASILGFASLLREELKDAGPDSQEAVRVIQAETLRVADIVKTVLAVTRKHASGSRECCDLNDVVRHAALLRKFECLRHRIRIEIEPSERMVLVTGSPQQLLQVLLNLLINAEHAIIGTRSHGRISITMRVGHGRVQVLVSDDGCGVPQHAVDHLFEPFFTTKSTGSGLGLSISQTIIKSHGGELRMLSTSSHGTTFSIELPCRLHGELEPLPCVTEVRRAALIDASLAGSVLIVDDEPEIVEILSNYLERRGLQTEGAMTGRSALTQLSKRSFDLIVLDFFLPDMNARRIFDEIQSLNLHQQGRILVMSGSVENPQVTSFIESTGLPLLRKPFTFSDLVDHLQDALGSVKKEEAVGLLQVS